MTRITVAIFTYSPSLGHARHGYAVDTVQALLDNLEYDGELRWHIADDGSPPEHVMELTEMLLGSATVSDSERRGYGASYNAMTQIVHRRDDDLVLCVEDDWKLLEPLDLTPLARAIEATAADAHAFGRINCVRLGYLGWTRQLQGRLIRPIPGQTFLMLDPMSQEHHVFSAGPRLETVGFERRLGLWPEHCIAGSAELEVAARPESRHGIAWPLDIGINAALDNPSKFCHIGGISVKDEATI